jgi:hypothetical protein
MEERMERNAAQRVLDRMETADVAHRYATAIDRKDWALLRTVFDDEVEADFRSFGAREVYRGPADGWVAAVRDTVAGLDATQHLMANHVQAFAGPDRCALTCYLRAEHVLLNDRGDDLYTIGGYYDWTLVRAADGWRAVAYALTVTWARGNRGVLALARRRVKQG